MPFASDKQRRYLYSQKPEVAKKFADHKAEGGFTEDGIATHYRNGKKKPQSQIDYERRVKETNAKVASQLGPLAQAAAGFVPGVGEAMDAKDAYDAWSAGDYATAAGIAGLGAIGLVPGVGDAIAGSARTARNLAKNRKQLGQGLKMLAEGNPNAKLAIQGAAGKGRQLKGPLAPEIAYATNKFHEPVGHMTKKEQNFSKAMGGGPLADKIAKDMSREFADPSLAVGAEQAITPVRGKSSGTRRDFKDHRGKLHRRGEGAHPLSYKPYQLPDELGGDYVHALYNPDQGTVANLLGGTGETLPAGYGRHYGQVAGTPDRPAGGFAIVTKPQVQAGHPGKAGLLRDKVKTEGPIGGGKGPKKPRHNTKPHQKQQGSLATRSDEKARRLAALRAAGLIK